MAKNEIDSLTVKDKQLSCILLEAAGGGGRGRDTGLLGVSALRGPDERGGHRQLYLDLERSKGGQDGVGGRDGIKSGRTDIEVEYQGQ